MQKKNLPFSLFCNKLFILSNFLDNPSDFIHIPASNLPTTHHPPPLMALPFPSFHTWPLRSSSEPHPSPNPTPGFPVSSNDSYAALDVDSFQLQRNRRAAKSSTTSDVKGANKVNGNNGRRKMQRGRRRNHSLDMEFDFVLVQPEYFSGSDSEGSDWSVGWFEPHAPEFSSDTEPENSFAVLVPCYGAPAHSNGGKGRFGQEDNTDPQVNSKSQLWAAVLSNLSNNSHADTNFYLQQWVSSLQT